MNYLFLLLLHPLKGESENVDPAQVAVRFLVVHRSVESVSSVRLSAGTSLSSSSKRAELHPLFLLGAFLYISDNIFPPSFFLNIFSAVVKPKHPKAKADTA